MSGDLTRAELVAINAGLCYTLVTIAVSLGALARRLHSDGQQREAMALYASSVSLIGTAKRLRVLE